jgi:hypothetical protein
MINYLLLKIDNFIWEAAQFLGSFFTFCKNHTKGYFICFIKWYYIFEVNKKAGIKPANSIGYLVYILWWLDQ